jgi:ProP effector
MTIRKENIHAALTDLATRYPRAFVLEKYRPHRPLKVGVAADILARCPVLTRRELGPALGVYAKRVMYLQSLVAGAIRIDLDGNPAGEVSAADAEHAAATLAEILAAREAKRAAAMVAKNASRITRQAAATAPAPPAAAAAAVEPSAAKVLTLKERPVLRLPAFRQQRG